MCHSSHQEAAEGSGSASDSESLPCSDRAFVQEKQEGVKEAQQGHSGPAEESGLGSGPCANSPTTRACPPQSTGAALRFLGLFQRG